MYRCIAKGDSYRSLAAGTHDAVDAAKLKVFKLMKLCRA